MEDPFDSEEPDVVADSVDLSEQPDVDGHEDPFGGDVHEPEKPSVSSGGEEKDLAPSLGSPLSSGDVEHKSKYYATVTDPIVVGSIITHIEYTVTCRPGLDGTPETDFDFLRNNIAKNFACILIPQIPKKKLMGSYVGSTEWVEQRRKGLQKFLNRILATDFILKLPIVSPFLSHNIAFYSTQNKFPDPTVATVTENLKANFGQQIEEYNKKMSDEPEYASLQKEPILTLSTVSIQSKERKVITKVVDSLDQFVKLEQKSSTCSVPIVDPMNEMKDLVFSLNMHTQNTNDLYKAMNAEFYDSESLLECFSALDNAFAIAKTAIQKGGEARRFLGIETVPEKITKYEALIADEKEKVALCKILVALLLSHTATTDFNYRCGNFETVFKSYLGTIDQASKDQLEKWIELHSRVVEAIH